jgi:hypothetical protein
VKDVIVLNYDDKKCNFIMPSKQKHDDLWSIITRPVDSINSEDVPFMSSSGINYSDAITMQDIQNMHKNVFDDVLDVGAKKPRAEIKAKLVRFIDKFNDPDVISDLEAWSVSENSQTPTPNLRGSIKNEL